MAHWLRIRSRRRSVASAVGSSARVAIHAPYRRMTLVTTAARQPVKRGVAVTAPAGVAPPGSLPGDVPGSGDEVGTGPVVTDTSSNRNPFVAVFGSAVPLARMSRESTVRLTWSAGVGLLSVSSV